MLGFFHELVLCFLCLGLWRRLWRWRGEQWGRWSISWCPGRIFLNNLSVSCTCIEASGDYYSKTQSGNWEKLNWGAIVLAAHPCSQGLFPTQGREKALGMRMLANLNKTSELLRICIKLWQSTVPPSPPFLPSKLLHYMYKQQVLTLETYI